MVLQRNEINEKDTWDLSPIYPTDQAWEEALKDLTEQLETVAQYEGHLLDSEDSLLEITELLNFLLRWNAKWRSFTFMLI